MLNQMVGRIKAKPGSKAEMGEVSNFDDDDINVHFSQDELEPAVLSMSRINMSGLLMKIHFKL
ncbi:unnamed protein product [Brassica oleracea var. botrytis]